MTDETPTKRRCRTCRGSGVLQEDLGDGVVNASDCDACDGTGWISTGGKP